VLGQVRQSIVCDICAVLKHATDMCPQLQEDAAPQVNAIEGFINHPRKNEP
jgi:hypothetical protein